MREFSTFIIVGIINTSLSFIIILTLIYLSKTPPVFNNIFGYAVGLISSYLLNKFFTFKSQEKSHKEIIKFIFIFLIAYAINLISLIFLIRLLEVNELTAQILSGFIYTFISYFLNKHFVFKN
jgi:putative flippase GtrA